MTRSPCSSTAQLFKRQRPDAGPDTPYGKKKVDLADTNGTRYDDSGGYMFDGGNAKHLAHPPFTFPAVPYAPGTLKAVGYLGGKPVATDAVRTPEAPRSLRLAFDTARHPLVADGADARSSSAPPLWTKMEPSYPKTRCRR